MQRLLPDQVRELWQQREQCNRSADECYIEQEQLTDRYRKIWEQALCVETHELLEESVLWELGQYTKYHDFQELRNRCQQALFTLKTLWQDPVREGDRASIEQFYDKTYDAIYELMWWHTLSEDYSPLASVTALEFAQEHGCRH